MLSVKNNGNNSISIISEGVKITGEIHFPGSAKVDGIVVGDIISENTLTIGKEGSVESNIKTKNAVILGKFEGKMSASGLVEVAATGKFIGKLTQDNAMLKIEKGGLFKGKSIVKEKKVLPLNTFEKENKKIPKIVSLVHSLVQFLS